MVPTMTHAMNTSVIALTPHAAQFGRAQRCSRSGRLFPDNGELSISHARKPTVGMECDLCSPNMQRADTARQFLRDSVDLLLSRDACHVVLPGC